MVRGRKRQDRTPPNRRQGNSIGGASRAKCERRIYESRPIEPGKVFRPSRTIFGFGSSYEPAIGERMLTRSYRPLTNAEREAVRHMADEPWWKWAWMDIGFAAGVGAVIEIGVRTLFQLEVAFRTPVIGVLCGAAVGGYVLWKTQRLIRRAERSLKPAGVEEEAEVLSVRASEAIEVEEVEDEGRGFFLDVGDGTILFLQGQYLYPGQCCQKGEFPNREFEIVRARYAREALGVTCTGNPLTPTGRCRLADVVPNPQQYPEDCQAFRGVLGDLAGALEHPVH